MTFGPFVITPSISKKQATFDCNIIVKKMNYKEYDIGLILRIFLALYVSM
jgi:hypothetical protein